MSKNKKNSPKESSVKGGSHITLSQCDAILEWLQVKDNFALIVGSAAQNKRVIAGQKLTKKAGYEKMAKDVNISFANHAVSERTSWDGDKAMRKFQNLHKKYNVGFNYFCTLVYSCIHFNAL